jgi:hypothetical protein
MDSMSGFGDFADLGSGLMGGGEMLAEAAPEMGADLGEMALAFAKRGGRIRPFAAGGLAVRQHAAAGKFVTPGYDPEENPQDIMDQVVESGMQSPAQLESEQKGMASKR